MEKLIQGVCSQSYDGTSDPKEFLKSFQLQAAMFGWNDDKQSEVIQFYLKGKAERIFNALEVGKQKSIAEIKKANISGNIEHYLKHFLLHNATLSDFKKTELKTKLLRLI